MAITPPEQKIWWNQPLDKVEGTWVIIALVWCLILFLWMPWWHLYGKQNLSNESYRTKPEHFEKKVEAMVAKYKVGEEGKTGIPVVHPPEGSDVYLMARLWDWYPILELEKDKTYKFHISSMDYQHGFSVQPVNINLQILPGYETVLKITPDKAGTYGVVCNEFCGAGHHQMLGKIIVK